MATVLITGTNRGLGLEFVKRFCQQGDDVIATCRNSSKAPELQALSEANSSLRLMNLDVSDQESMASFASALGDAAIDVFINNAGVYGPRNANFGNVASGDWESVLRVNAISPMLLTQLIISNLRLGNTGRRRSRNGTSGTARRKKKIREGICYGRMPKRCLTTGVRPQDKE